MASACPICCRDTRLYASFGKYEVRNCSHCHAAVCDPVPTFEELTEYYAAGYFDSDRYKPIESSGVDAASHPGWNRRIDTLSRHLSPRDETVCCLDIGAATGIFLECAAARGWECHAVEFSDEGRRQISHRVKLATPVEKEFNASNYSDECFDAITMWAVIEHMPYHATFLDDLRVKLVPHGVLALSTPNLDSLNRYIFGKKWRYFLPPEHVILYSYRGLIELIERSGFKLLQGRSIYSQRAFWQGLGGESRHLTWRVVAHALQWISQVLNMGDTTEVYFRRVP